MNYSATQAQNSRQLHPSQQQQHPASHSPKLTHREPRAAEMIDALKHEFELLYEEVSYSKHHRKELEGKRTR